MMLYGPSNAQTGGQPPRISTVSLEIVAAAISGPAAAVNSGAVLLLLLLLLPRMRQASR